MGDWFDGLVSWLTDHVEWLFDAIGAAVEGTVDGLTGLLTGPPALVMIAVFALVALVLSGWRLGLFTLAGFALIESMELWEPAMDSLALVLVAALVAVAISIPLGIAAARNDMVSRVVRPVLDLMQTMPAFVYLIPAIFFFSIGVVPGVVATVIFALPPGVRLTELGIRGVDAEMVEAGEAFGTPPGRILTRIQIPLAMPSIMAGINQLIMLSLSMVVIAGMVGAGGLGNEVLEGIQRVNIAQGFEGGLAVVVLAIFLDRLTSALGDRTAVARATAQMAR
ncbi:proline/glycine betaine ABC transporter permease [Actinomadura viridis]|uniref:ABC-type proline/glycine betaine transport system permease subunit n=1 Tax=Actinomadura viridis TaxID=58110 RepID=A0A931GU04_9ACTN|nr:proline/glycine betaine ABC transporter permease [Actinomadura viridis]MBG6092614.1 ABC-type proline/glycine betaine transport system permease subunit [Actinomadura viridis]